MEIKPSKKLQIPEARIAYAELEHSTLINKFYATEGDKDIGRELAIRLFEHAGYEGDPGTTPLIGRNGFQLIDDNNRLTLADYVNYAAGHHFDAIGEILDFLQMEPGESNYEGWRNAMFGRLGVEIS